MKLNSKQKAYSLLIQSVEDLVFANLLLYKGLKIRFKDYRRQKSNMEGVKQELRGEKQKVVLVMTILKSELIQGCQLRLTGLLEGSVFHTYYLKNAELVEVKKKVSPFEIKVLQYANSIKRIHVVIADDTQYSVIELMDYTHTVLLQQELNSSVSIEEQLKPLIEYLSTKKIRQYILISNFVILNILRKNLRNITFIPYVTNIAVWQIIDKASFYRSNQFKKLKQFTNMHKDRQVWCNINTDKIIGQQDFRIYEDLNLIDTYYVSIDYVHEFVPAANKLVIVSNGFSDVYNLPKIFATVKYVF